MFTGLIEEIGEVKGIERTGTGMLLTVRSRLALQDTKVGDSISIDGACQTVTDVGRDCFTIFASRVTCSVTTLGSFKIGRKVNLERALMAQSRIGGHLVQGHVDGKGRIGRIKSDENGLEIEIHVDERYLRYIVERGSVAVDLGFAPGSTTNKTTQQSVRSNSNSGMRLGTRSTKQAGCPCFFPDVRPRCLSTLAFLQTQLILR